ncbi:hypothetical protein PINS_up002788 [Pythium insidiosum]|nr:hypothetical protein PINS_up002788 [Pythium insidiosum]
MATLKVTLVRIKDLPVSDSLLEGKTSDPFVVFTVRKEVQQSSCIMNNLNPQWIPRETFDFPVVDLESDVLQVSVFDHDTYNAHDLMATLVLPVSKFMSRPNSKHKESFALDVQPEYSTQACHSVIDLEICLQTDVHGEVTMRIWENQVWFLSTGWIGSDTEIYKKWSAYDDSVTSNRFEEIAPPTPRGPRKRRLGIRRAQSRRRGLAVRAQLSRTVLRDQGAHDLRSAAALGESLHAPQQQQHDCMTQHRSAHYCIAPSSTGVLPSFVARPSAATSMSHAELQSALLLHHTMRGCTLAA